jgi:hypothetical protein
MVTPRSLTADTLRQDAQQVATFLRALAGVLPDQVDEKLLEFLDGVSQNDLSLTLLLQALVKGKG